jgi:uncharacterized protein (DUF2461 family)
MTVFPLVGRRQHFFIGVFSLEILIADGFRMGSVWNHQQEDHKQAAEHCFIGDVYHSFPCIIDSLQRSGLRLTTLTGG